MKDQSKKMSGAALYAVLSVFVERIIYGNYGELALIIIPTSPPASYCAFVAGIPEVNSTNQSSAAFTASAVAQMVMCMGKAEGVVFSGNGHGLGIKLEKEISRELAILVEQLSDCVETVRRCEGPQPFIPSLSSDSQPARSLEAKM